MTMQKFIQAILNFIRDEEGSSAIEYVLIASMVAGGLVTFVTPIRTAVTTIFTDIQTALESASGA